MTKTPATKTPASKTLETQLEKLETISPQKLGTKKAFRWVAAAVLLLIALFNMGQISTGNVGVSTLFGVVNQTPITPGLYMAGLRRVREFTAKEVSFQMTDLKPKSRDNLTMSDLDIDIYFKTNPAAIPKLYSKYQGDIIRHADIVEKGTSDFVVGYSRVLRAAREASYAAVSTMDATTMHTKRAELAEDVQRRLQKELDASDPDSFIVTSVNIRNLTTDPAIEKAIRAKAEADQIIEQKRKEVEIAKAETEKRIVEAQSIAEANRIIGESLNGAVKEIRLAEIYRDTMTAVASKEGNVMMVPNGVNPLVNMSSGGK